MLERLDYVKLAPKRILDAGAGPAPQAASLLKRYRGATLLALDFSLPMLQARPGRGWLNRLAGRAAPVPVCADLGRMPLAPRCCSLVWSNMALHWAADPQRAIEEFHRVLEVEGLLMFSTIGPDTLKELRSAFPPTEGAPHVHGFVDMHDLGDMLVRAGFADPVMDQETLTVEWDGPQALCDDLRLLGGNVSPLRFRGLRTGRWKASLHRALESLRGGTGKLTLDFEVIYGHAFKASLTRSVDGETRVPLEDVRRLMPSARASN